MIGPENIFRASSMATDVKENAAGLMIIPAPSSLCNWDVKLSALEEWGRQPKRASKKVCCNRVRPRGCTPSFYFVERNAASFSRNLVSAFVSHSHTTRTFQPSSRNSRSLRLSRFTLASNFCCQKSTRVWGVLAFEQFRCRCQKQPCTKIAFLCFWNTMSGVPGRPRC